MVIGQVKVKSHEFSELGIGGRETCLNYFEIIKTYHLEK